MAQVKETYRYNLGNTVNEGEAINVLADKISEKSSSTAMILTTRCCWCCGR